jgi:hypothetical protein
MNMGLKKSRASELFQNGFGKKSKRPHAGGRFFMGLAANTCTQLKAKLGVCTLPELMRIAIQHLPSASGKTQR